MLTVANSVVAEKKPKDGLSGSSKVSINLSLLASVVFPSYTYLILRVFSLIDIGNTFVYFLRSTAPFFKTLALFFLSLSLLFFLSFI